MLDGFPQNLMTPAQRKMFRLDRELRDALELRKALELRSASELVVVKTDIEHRRRLD